MMIVYSKNGVSQTVTGWRAWLTGNEPGKDVKSGRTPEKRRAGVERRVTHPRAMPQ